METPRLWHGVLGGLLGGLVFAGIMALNGTLVRMGMLTLPLIGRMVGFESSVVGFLVHMINSAVIGALYVVVFGRVEKGMVDGLHLGMLYGAVWWFLGPLTLMPLILGEPLGTRWNLGAILSMFPSLIGHVVYGWILGMTVGAFRDRSLPVEGKERPREKPLSERTTREMERPPRSELPKTIPQFIRRRPAPGTEEPGDGK